MGKFRKNKFKATLNKLSKKQNLNDSSSNKIIKKKLNIEKNINFQKEILKEAVTERSAMVKNITAQELLLKELSKNTKKSKKDEPKEVIKKPKIKAVEKHKKRQKTQINNTRLLLNLMKKKS